MATYGAVFKVTDPSAPARAAATAAEAAARALMADAADATPVRDKSKQGGRSDYAVPGKLRSAWDVRDNGDGTWDVFNDTDYAIPVEFGSVHNPVPARMLDQAIGKSGLAWEDG